MVSWAHRSSGLGLGLGLVCAWMIGETKRSPNRCRCRRRHFRLPPAAACTAPPCSLDDPSKVAAAPLLITISNWQLPFSCTFESEIRIPASLLLLFLPAPVYQQRTHKEAWTIPYMMRPFEQWVLIASLSQYFALRLIRMTLIPHKLLPWMAYRNGWHNLCVMRGVSERELAVFNCLIGGNAHQWHRCAS